VKLVLRDGLDGIICLADEIVSNAIQFIQV